MTPSPRFLLRCALAGVLAMMASCIIPTDVVCGCTPSRSKVFVRGTVTDAAGRSVAGARVYLDGVVADQAARFPVSTNDLFVVTDAGGAYAGAAYSVSSPGMLLLRAAIVRSALPDTVRIDVGPANFRFQGETPDTVSASLLLP